MKEYPYVYGEYETLQQVINGMSIARYGDGEFNLIKGGNCVSQVAHPTLQKELKDILVKKEQHLIIGIPTMDPKGQKYDRWIKYAPKYKQFLSPKVTYYSAFITRPDSAQWCFGEEYWSKLKSLWANKDLTLVRGSDRSLSPKLLPEARSIKEVTTPYSNAYAEIDRIEKDILAVTPIGGLVILCCGATATVLASRLCIKGFHAVDLGHVGMFMDRLQ